jgi:hypothetical protein
MSKIDDTQIDKVLFHGQTAHQEMHTPAGQIPVHGTDKPLVAPQVVGFSAGKQITPTGTITVGVQGLRLANPA